MKIDFFGHTDIGKKRKFNEDNYICVDFADSIPGEDKSPLLLAVADGIGGHVGGETASSVAIDALHKRIEKDFKKKIPKALNVQKIMEDAIQDSNHDIFREATENKALTGMGTTLVTAFITGDEALISNVGDSRAYLIRDHEINQVTHDHSWKAEQLKMNVLSKKEILDSPFKHTITRSLGFQSDVQVDSFQIDLIEDDYILLCSDGLYESIPDPIMLKMVHKHKKTEKICRRMVKTANQRSGHDNITVVIAHITELGDKDKAKIPPTDTILLPPK